MTAATDLLVTPADVVAGDKSALVIGPFGSNLKNSDFTVEGVPLVFVRDIRAADFSRPRAYVSRSKAEELRAHLVLPGDVLVTKMGDPPGDAAVYTGQVPAIITADCIRLRPSPRFDASYVAHVLRSPGVRRQILSITSGAAQQKVSLERFRTGIRFAAPPLEKQRRIAAILDHADALRAKRRRVLAHLDSLIQAIFHDMFGEVENTPTTHLAQLAEVTSGITKGRRTSAPTSPTPYLAVSNVQAGHLRMDVVKEIEVTQAEIRRYALRDGDLVLTEGGDPDKLGRGTVWRNELPLCLHQNHVFRVRLQQGDRILPDYLAAYMADRRARIYFLRSAKQTTGIASINMTQLKALPVSVPSLDKQYAYVARAEQVRAQQATVRRACAVDDELFASLQSRAFRGDV